MSHNDEVLAHYGLKTAGWKGWTEDMPVQVVTTKGTEVFKNLADAKKKYRDLNPDRQGKQFTWAMKGRVRGQTAIRFEDWKSNDALSRAAAEHYGLYLKVADELSDLKKAKAAAKKGHWADAARALKTYSNKWRKDRDMGTAFNQINLWADEAAYDDSGKYSKAVLALLDKMEAAFKAGYPSMEGVKVLKKRAARLPSQAEVLKKKPRTPKLDAWLKNLDGEKPAAVYKHMAWAIEDWASFGSNIKYGKDYSLKNLIEDVYDALRDMDNLVDKDGKDIISGFKGQAIAKEVGAWYEAAYKSHWKSGKTAGGTGYPISNKDWAVDGKRIQKVCKDSGKFKKEFLASMDWGKIKWEKPKAHIGGVGTMAYWYVYPKGDFNGKGDSIYGYVGTEWHVGHNAVEIQGDIVVKH